MKSEPNPSCSHTNCGEGLTWFRSWHSPAGVSSHATFGAFSALKLSPCTLPADKESHVNFLVTGSGCRRMMRGDDFHPEKGTRGIRLGPMTEPRLYKIAHGLVRGFDIPEIEKIL
jgi:hypothetical protein